MTKLLLILLVSIICLPLAAQEIPPKKIYVSRDAKGVMIFSDMPFPGAEEVDFMTKSNIMDTASTEYPQQKPKAATPFEINITQPVDQETIRDNTGSVYITGEIIPLFERGLRVGLRLNGTLTGETQSNTHFLLREVDRGEHKIQMELYDQNGKLIAVSKETTFYLHRASTLSPR